MKTILIIDRHLETLEVLADLFIEAGYFASSAQDASEGTSMIKKLKPDLVVLDMNVPAGGGSAVLDRLKDLTPAFQTPLLILKYTMTDEKKQLDLETKCKLPFLIKFVELNEIIQTTNEILKPHRPSAPHPMPHN